MCLLSNYIGLSLYCIFGHLFDQSEGITGATTTNPLTQSRHSQVDARGSEAAAAGIVTGDRVVTTTLVSNGCDPRSYARALEVLVREKEGEIERMKQVRRVRVVVAPIAA